MDLNTCVCVCVCQRWWKVGYLFIIYVLYHYYSGGNYRYLYYLTRAQDKTKKGFWQFKLLGCTWYKLQKYDDIAECIWKYENDQIWGCNNH